MQTITLNSFIKSCVLLFVLSVTLTAQKKVDLFLTPAPEINKARVIGVSSGVGVAYTGVVVGLSKAWYSQHEQGRFHFYNDNKEWLQHDKVGHTWTAYVETGLTYDLYRWAGLNKKKALITASVLGWSYQATIEVLDGFSERWGASYGDIIANTIGVAMFSVQEALWDDQIFQWKFSSHKVDYSDFPQAFQQRAERLYGTSFTEKILKDYNGQVYWLSFNPVRLFNEQSKIPDWLQLSLGYGIKNIFGGYENVWLLENGEIYDGSHVERLRQFYFSLDVDLTRIPVKKRWAKTLLKAANMIKIPFPALQLDSNGKFKFQPLMF